MNKLERAWWEGVADIYDEIADKADSFGHNCTCINVGHRAFEYANVGTRHHFYKELQRLWSWRGEYQNIDMPVGALNSTERTEDAIYHLAVYMADEIRTLLEECNDE